MAYSDGDPLGQRLRIALGATLSADPSTYTWMDVTGDVAFDVPITLTTGGADEAQETNSDFQITVRDNEGRWDVENAVSDLYGLVDVGTPIEFAINLGDGSGWLVQFSGRIASIGDDYTTAPERVRRPLVAAGILRDLGVSKQLNSAVHRNVRNNKAVRYYTLEEGSDARQAASDIANQPPMVQAGLPPQFSARSGVYGSLPVPKFGTGQCLTTTFPVYNPTGTSVYWHWLSNVGTLTVSTIELVMTCLGSPVLQWQIRQDPTFCPRIYAIGANGATLYSSAQFGAQPGMIGSTGPNLPDSHPWWWNSVKLTKSGGNILIDYQITAPWMDAIGNYGSITYILAAGDTLASTAMGGFNGWTITPAGAEDLAIGHLALYDSANGAPLQNGSGAVVGWPQSAHDRISGVCNEMHIPNSVSTNALTAMGPQQPGTTLSLLRDGAKADHGILDDCRGRIDYTALYDLYNATSKMTIDGTEHEIAMPFAGVRDDQKRRNSMTISRPGGGSATFDDLTDQAKAGFRGGSDTLNLASDMDLDDHASYAVVIGTVPGKRYPQVSIKLWQAPALAPYWARMRIGDRLTVVNPPKGGSRQPLQLQVRGATQTWVNRTVWNVTMNTVRADPYNAAVVEDPIYGRPESDSCTLSTDYGMTDTSVTFTAVPPAIDSTNYPADFPFDVNWQGERITVSSIAGTTAPQTAVIVRSVNGVRKIHPGPTTWALWQQMRAPL